jgi:hypothetical protein
MLSINYISNYLSNKQTKIDNFYYERINDFEKNDTENNSSNNIINEDSQISKNIKKNFLNNVPSSFELFFNKSMNDFYYDNRIFKNKSPIFTLLNCIFYIGNESYNFFSEKERELIMKDFIKKIDNDLFEKDLYTKFDYTKNRKFNKADIQEVLKNTYQFKNPEKLWLFIQYLSDYLGINIYIFKVKNNQINHDETEKYLSKYYGNKYNKYLPNFVIILENELYKPVLKKKNNSDSFIKYSENIDVIDTIWNYLKIFNEEKKVEDKIENIDKVSIYKLDELKKMKVDEIKILCNKHKIELHKLSVKTSKMINKLKEELIDELLHINNNTDIIL